MMYRLAIAAPESLIGRVSVLVSEGAAKATALLLVAAIGTLLMRRRSAGQRHAVWGTVMLAALLTPGLSLLLPQWRVLPNWLWLNATEDVTHDRPPSTRVPWRELAGDSQPARREQSRDPSLVEAAPGRSGARAEHPDCALSHYRINDRGMSRSDGSFPDAGATRSTNTARYGVSVPSAAPGLILVWLAGMLLGIGRLAVSLVQLSRLEAASRHCTDGRLLTLHRLLCRRVGLSRPVRLLISTSASMPMAWGLWRSSVCMPSEAERWCSKQVTSVLTHELAHIRRRDAQWEWVVQLARAVYWFHPLVWLAAWRLQVERERACDDLVVRGGTAACDYAGQLLQLVAVSRPRRVLSLPALSMGAPHRLEERIRALLDARVDRQVASGGTWAAVAVVAIGLTLPLAMLEAQSVRPDDNVTGVVVAAADTVSPVIRLSHVGKQAAGSKSLAGSGHAVQFTRPDTAEYLCAIEIFAARYGLPTAPEEDFHVYVLDENQKVIQAYPFPYSTIERGELEWYTLRLPAVKVPKEFYVALSFNPHQTKGVYVGFDHAIGATHSFTGRPTQELQPTADDLEWMVQVVLTSEWEVRNPFADSGGDQ